MKPFCPKVTILLFALLFVANPICAGFPVFEAYSGRPDIRNIPLSSDHSDSSTSENEHWGSLSHVESEGLKLGSLEAVAEILCIYPDYSIYFMGRDAEFLYDTAITLTSSTPDEARIHLILTSSSILKDPNMKNYLEQEGISESALKRKQHFLFVDTGFTGSASAKIINLYSKEYADQFKTHLLCSNNPEIPSTRVFLTSFIPFFENVDPSILKWNLVGKFENFPMFFHSGDHFEKDKSGIWTPMSPTVSDGILGGQVDKAKALNRMKDIKAFISQSSQLDRFHERMVLWKTLHQLWTEKKFTDLKNEFKKILKGYKKLGRSIVLDFIESMQRNQIQDKQNGDHLNQLSGELGLGHKKMTLKKKVK